MKKHISAFLSLQFIVLSLFAVQQQVTPVDYVRPQIDTHKSRWFFFSSASRSFGMVSLSPDTQTEGSWNSGYLYNSKEIRCFSHVHCW
ncbi:glycoside hydrolase family 92 protein, partial [Bacteroides ovatus]